MIAPTISRIRASGSVSCDKLVNTRHGPATFMMMRVTNGRSNGAPVSRQRVAERGHDRTPAQDGGDFGDHGRWSGELASRLASDRGARSLPDGARKSRQTSASMLGQFLEFSVAARPLAASFEFYRSLGFASIPVGDTLRDPYLALFDGDVAIGLHDRDAAGPAAHVRPAAASRLRARATPRSASRSTQAAPAPTTSSTRSASPTRRPGSHAASRRARSRPATGTPKTCPPAASFFEVRCRPLARGVERVLAAARARGSRRRARRRTAGSGSRATGSCSGCTRLTACPGLSFRCHDSQARAANICARRGSSPRDRHADRGSTRNASRR